MRLLALLSVTAPLIASAPQENPPAGRPNILFILTDDQRPDAMGCYGNSSLRTPNFDAIAREGARFEAFYSAAPLDAPSRAAILTGLYPHQSGMVDNAAAGAPAGLHTLPAILSRAGYATGFVGKAQPAGDPRRWGFQEAPVWFSGLTCRHRNPRLVVHDVEKEVEGQVTRIFADAAIGWIERHRQERWFLWLATTAPGTPYVMDPKHPYKQGEIEAPPLWPRHEELSDQDWAGYYSTISMLDEQVGRILARLRELGLLDRTFVFVTSDSGNMLGSYGYAGKEVWFEESVRVPALARLPDRVPAGSRVQSPAVNLDLFPTFCELAGASPPGKREAVSLLPALSGQGAPRSTAYSEARMKGEGDWQMLRTDRYKYVRFDHGREHLYDLYGYGGERRDLATGARHADTLDEMRLMRLQWLEATPDRRP